MFGFKKRKKELIRDIAREVISQLENSRGWQEFLPPVSHEGLVYMMTKNGDIYRMNKDFSGFETICKIHTH